MERYLCIHGHFYQPPRENPWLEAIELQDSAYPYHDWNARVSAESYGPNATSRVLDGKGRITRIVNNYARISFNFGPTLLDWLQAQEPGTYEAILEADRTSVARFGGHGNALAQAYNHIIMPLANARDRRTQVHWGVRDFERRFGRRPEGMWLPETGVDIDSLEALAEAGIRFTILEPGQAARFRPLRPEGPDATADADVAAAADADADAVGWRDTSGGRIDPTRPYLQRLPSGREIAIFFYDGPISRGVAFEKLLENGERFARRLMDAFDGARDHVELVNIATDGETYGHHHRHGDMALAFALELMDARSDVRLTNYGEYLELHPPEWEVEIAEDTSWSCAHGVERWRSDCGCHTGGQPGWRQAWRQPLREALDWLRDAVAPAFERAAGELLKDPWAARDDYIEVVLDRSTESVDSFLALHRRHHVLDGEERVRVLKLLELQRHAMLMYTSCGWFFNELSGIETVQVLQYAGRVLQLARELFHEDLEASFLQRLESAHSNLPDRGTGRDVYERNVRPAMVDLPKVGAHYAVVSLFEEVATHERVYCYDVELLRYERSEAGRARLGLGRAQVKSALTGEATEVSFGAVHLGDHNVYGGVREFLNEEEYDLLTSEARAAFRRADMPAIIRVIDRHFEDSTYSLGTLFRDEQNHILDSILRGSIESTEATYRRIYADHSPLMRFIESLVNVRQPRAFRLAADFVLNLDLRRLLESDVPDLQAARDVLAEARMSEVQLDEVSLGFTLTGTLARLAGQLRDAPLDVQRVGRLAVAAEVAAALPFEVQLWEPQNVFYHLRETTYPAVLAAARGEADGAADGAAGAAAGILNGTPGEWADLFRSLGRLLAIEVPG